MAYLWENMIGAEIIIQIKLRSTKKAHSYTFFFQSMGDYPIKFYSAGGSCLLWGKLQHFLGVNSLLFGLFAFVSQV